jgi:hypothetical protein
MEKRLASSGAVVAFVLALSACGWKTDGVARLEELYPQPAGMDAGAQGPVCTMPDDAAAAAVQPGGACASLKSGAFAVRIVQFGSMSPSGMGPWNITLADHFLAKPSADGKQLDLTFCAQRSSLTKQDGTPVPLGKTEMAAATNAAIGAAPFSLPLPSDGTFQVADLPWLWGVCLDAKDGCTPLAHPLIDELPTDPGDAHLWDQDEDSHPGVTVHVLSPDGYRYMARRSRFSFGKATIAADFGWLVGPISFEITEHALGASTSVLTTVAPISARAECDSVYQMRCVPTGYTCDQLLTDAAALFRDAPH